MLWVALASLFTVFVLPGLKWKFGQHVLNALGGRWHIFQTFVSSPLSIVTGPVIKVTGFPALGLILGMAIGGVLLLALARGIREAVHILEKAT